MSQTKSQQPEKAFLDTSVARKMLHGTSLYRKHLKRLVDDRAYISQFVAMEYRRSLVRKAISFISVLKQQGIPTVEDGFALWEDRYKTSEVKMVCTLAQKLLTMHALSKNEPRDKEAFIVALSEYVIRLDQNFRSQFTDCGVSSSNCERARMVPQRKRNLNETIDEFIDAFDDTESCRNKCNVDYFLGVKQRPSVELYVRHANQNQNLDQGFVKVAEKLKEALENGSKSYTCSRCEKIGDAIIALDVPEGMILHHVDESFDPLCDLIKQQHFKHEHQRSFHKRMEQTGDKKTV